jgi:myo-inositol-1(or 4)-monophosphatase
LLNRTNRPGSLLFLKEQFPSHGLLCEESGSRPGATSYCWIIDPLDGTVNFLHGYPHFCISIALHQETTNLIGVVYQPYTDELYTAALGYGAFLNKEILQVSNTTNIADSVLEVGFNPSHELRQLQHEMVGRQLQCCGAIRERGSAALGLSAVAHGVCDGYCELGLHLWDIAAASLLVTEAGGRVTQRNAQSLSNNTVDILASNAALHHQIPF